MMYIDRLVTRRTYLSKLNMQSCQLKCLSDAPHVREGITGTDLGEVILGSFESAKYV